MKFGIVTLLFSAADPMMSMIASIRSGNIALKKVQKDTKVDHC